MKAIEISAIGAPDVLQLCDLEIPAPRKDEVLIEIIAAGVNRPDCLQRAGKYPAPKGANPLPGLEVAGRIVDIGKGIENSLIGREVMALTNGGGYAQYVAVPQGACILKPENLSFIEAAAIPETLFTVWHNLFQLGKLEAEDWVLIHGGASGIGTMAIQLANAFGAKIMVTAGSKEKCDLCLQLGAKVAINYHDQDFVKEVQDITNGHGADVILDMIAGSYVDRNYQAAAKQGRIVQIAVLEDAEARINIARLMMKRLVHTGSTLRARSDEFKGALARDIENRVLHFIKNGDVAPIIHSTFDLEETAKAHKLMESGKMYGKIVLKVKSL